MFVYSVRRIFPSGVYRSNQSECNGFTAVEWKDREGNNVRKVEEVKSNVHNNRIL